MMISARGLSLARMIRSITSTIGAVARTVIVFAVLLGKQRRLHRQSGCASSVLMICEISCASACER